MYDVAIIGSGPGGSVAATLLAKLGHSVLLLERGSHPRFAIGESTTPVMSKKIRNIGKIYDVPEFVDLSSYDRIKEANLGITCGPKELFHYFIHDKGQTVAEPNGINREILVQTPEIDTQLLRGESDKLLVEIAQRYGADYIDHTEVTNLDIRDDGITIDCKDKDGGAMSIETKFIIDATGFKSLISQKYDLRVADEDLDVPLNSRAIFTHFKDVGNFEEISGASEEFIKATPAPRSHATQHHCFEGGWIWFIPFENGVTSVGLNLDIDVYGNNDKSGEEEFWEIVNEYPIMKKMLEGRETLFPFIKTGRIQFQNKQAVGDRWVMLPASAAGLDAWFSTGMASTMIAVHRIVDILDTRVLKENNFSREHFLNYEIALFKEWKTIATMINGIYKSFRHFDVFKYYCFFCFMGAERFVKTGGYKRPHDMDFLMLSAGDEEFLEKFGEFYKLVMELCEKDEIDEKTQAYMQDFIQNKMKKYNYRDYGNPIYNGVHGRVEDDEDMAPMTDMPMKADVSQMSAKVCEEAVS